MTQPVAVMTDLRGSATDARGEHRPLKMLDPLQRGARVNVAAAAQLRMLMTGAGTQFAVL